MDEKKRLTINDYNNEKEFENTVKSFILNVCSLKKYTENDLTIFCSAFITPEYKNEQNCKDDYKRLKNLGDATIKLIIKKTLYNRYRKRKEDFLSPFAQHLYSNDRCPEYLFKNNIDLLPLIRFGKSLFNQSKEIKINTLFDIVNDCFKALIGALYITGHYSYAVKIVKKTFKNEIKNTYDSIIKEKDNVTTNGILITLDNELKSTFINRLKKYY